MDFDKFFREGFPDAFDDEGGAVNEFAAFEEPRCAACFSTHLVQNPDSLVCGKCGVEVRCVLDTTSSGKRDWHAQQQATQGHYLDDIFGPAATPVVTVAPDAPDGDCDACKRRAFVARLRLRRKAQAFLAVLYELTAYKARSAALASVARHVDVLAAGVSPRRHGEVELQPLFQHSKKKTGVADDAQRPLGDLRQVLCSPQGAFLKLAGAVPPNVTKFAQLRKVVASVKTVVDAKRRAFDGLVAHPIIEHVFYYRFEDRAVEHVPFEVDDGLVEH